MQIVKIYISKPMIISLYITLALSFIFFILVLWMSWMNYTEESQSHANWSEASIYVK